MPMPFHLINSGLIYFTISVVEDVLFRGIPLLVNMDPKNEIQVSNHFQKHPGIKLV